MSVVGAGTSNSIWMGRRFVPPALDDRCRRTRASLPSRRLRGPHRSGEESERSSSQMRESRRIARFTATPWARYRGRGPSFAGRREFVNSRRGASGGGAGVPGLEPRTTEPESAVLPITPYPNGQTGAGPTINRGARRRRSRSSDADDARADVVAQRAEAGRIALGGGGDRRCPPRRWARTSNS